MEIELSEYFQTIIPKRGEDLIKFLETKKFGKDSSSYKRTICQMMRNFNNVTDYKYQGLVSIVIEYLHHAVVKLKKYKCDWNTYIKTASKNNLIKSRSIFKPEKREIALSYLDIENHDIFKLYKELYQITNRPVAKELILESIYYTQQINKKLGEYEKMNH